VKLCWCDAELFEPAIDRCQRCVRCERRPWRVRIKCGAAERGIIDSAIDNFGAKPGLLQQILQQLGFFARRADAGAQYSAHAGMAGALDLRRVRW
jgi:hypothetical protein